MMFPLVGDLAAEKIPVAVTCRVLGSSKQAYYAWRAAPVTQREWDDAGRNRVNRLCSQQRLWSVHARKRGLSHRPGPPVHDDHVRRGFTAPAPNLLWLTDITEHPTAEGKLYLCAVKDACSERIVGYSIADRMTSQLAVDALRNALALRGQVTATVHSDRGSQFRAHAYARALRDAGLRGSMGRVGACADNAAMESFFALPQKNVLNRRRPWPTRDQLRLAIVVWIETTYHRRRRQDTLGRLTPIEYETLHQTAHAARPALPDRVN